MQPHNYQNLDDQFRDELRDASFLPPVGVWERIEAQLPAKKPFYIRYLWQLTASVAAIAIVLAALLINEQLSITSSDGVNEIAINQSAQEKSVLNKASTNEVDYDAKKTVKPSGSSDKSAFETIPQGDKRYSVDNTGAENATLSESKFKSNTGKSSSMLARQMNVVKKKVNAEKEALISSYLDDHPAGISEMNNVASATPSAPNVSSSPMASLNNESLYNQANFLESFPTQAFSYDEDKSYQPINQKVKTGKGMRQKMNVNRGFFMGPAFGYQFNRLSLQPFSPETDNSLMEYRLHGGVHYGIAFGYDFPSRFGIMGEWVYSSSEGQRFVEDFGDFSINKSIELDYMKLPLMMRYQMAFQGDRMKKPMMLNLLGGLHYSLLRSKNTYINGELAYFDQKFNKHQWGLLAGAELDLYATKQLFFTFGARGGFAANARSFPRMKGRDGTDPLAFNAGLYTRINFRFVQK